MKKILAVFGVAAVLAMASAPAAQLVTSRLDSSLHLDSGTSDEAVQFNGTVNSLSVEAIDDDILFVKTTRAGADTVTVRAGRAMNWVGVQIPYTGFEVIRTNATRVDVYWYNVIR